jgi:hypothetical protein
MASVVEIVTDRLRLRPFGADDLAAFVAYRIAVLRREWEAA